MERSKWGDLINFIRRVTHNSTSQMPLAVFLANERLLRILILCGRKVSERDRERDIEMKY